MKMSDKAPLLFGLLLSTLLAGCTRHSGFVPQDLALPSGEHVTILDTHGDSFTDVNHVKRHIFYIGYLTEHDFEDIRSLRKEALRVWAAFKPQIVGVDYDSCVVPPMKRTVGGSEEGRPFYHTRATGGAWIVSPVDENP